MSRASVLTVTVTGGGGGGGDVAAEAEGEGEGFGFLALADVGDVVRAAADAVRLRPEPLREGAGVVADVMEEVVLGWGVVACCLARFFLMS